MKNLTPVLATAIVLLICLSLFSFNTFAQSKKLVADETELIQLKSSVKVVTSNEKVFSLLLTEFNVEVTKYTVEFKTDRQGRYKCYSVAFKPEQLSKLNAFFVKINK